MGTGIWAEGPPRRRIGRAALGCYAAGSIAYGIKDNGFQTFLLLFYNQVVGLPALGVGAVLMLALLLDAAIDPLIGIASDRTRSSLGRRHVWMYASVVPIAAGWLLLWNPPATVPGTALPLLFATAVLVRTAISCYEIPSTALLAELTSDYDERTRIAAWRQLAGWAGGLAMLVAAYTLFLVPTADVADGVLNRGGYGRYAIAGAGAIAIAILVSAIGTRRYARSAPEPREARPIRRDLADALGNRGFRLLLMAGCCAYGGQGLAFGLANYLYGFVWRFTPAMFLVLSVALFAGVAAAFVIAPRVTRRFDKRVAAGGFLAVSPLFLALPYALRYLGAIPPSGPDALPWLLAATVANVACGVSGVMTATAMMADIVDQHAAATGRRAAGLFFAGNMLVQKAAGGLGLFAASAILWLVGFPAGARPGHVASPVLDHLTLLFAAACAATSWGAAILYARFPFGRQEHEARVAAAP